MGKLLYQGHASIRIITNEGTVIYVDPFIGEGYDIEADIVLITHEHPDHNKLELVPLKEDSVVIRHNTLKVGNIYNKTSIKGVEIEAVEAYNKNHDKAACVGFVLRFDNEVIYIAGDTSTTEDMKHKLGFYDITYAFLPVDGIYNMNAEEATKCAGYIDPKHSVPYHTNPQSPFSIAIAGAFNHEASLIIKNGEEIDLV